MTEEEQKRKSYQSPWQSQLEDTWQQIQDRPGFHYDVNADALWNQYKDRYVRQGQLAMEDTMGRAQSMTGGYANSYAQSVGQQTYDGYLQELTDQIPQFYRLAQDHYIAQGDALQDRYSVLSDLESKDYNRWLDDQAQQNWQTEWDEYIRRYNFENGLGEYAAPAPTYEEEPPKKTAGKSTAQTFVDNMLKNATNIKFDPERVINATNQLNDTQKKEAQKYLSQVLNGK